MADDSGINLQGFARRLAAVRGRIADAAARVGRDPGAVTLIGASKQVPAERLRDAASQGLAHLGENRVQEARDKIEALADLRSGLTWHLIGHLQSNKAKAAAALFDWVQSVDSPELARELDRRAGEAGRRLRVLVEVNTSGEATKFGVPPERTLEVLAGLAGLEWLEPRGFMTVGPLSEDEARVRAAYAALAERLRAAQGAFPAWRLDQLSMGMSGDFELAVEEGATIVRVGTALFGPRPAARAQ
jgi:pyridoxal phosphate enzyme (YggS family)